MSVSSFSVRGQRQDLHFWMGRTKGIELGQRLPSKVLMLPVGLNPEGSSSELAVDPRLRYGSNSTGGVYFIPVLLTL